MADRKLNARSNANETLYACVAVCWGAMMRRDVCSELMSRNNGGDVGDVRSPC